MKLLEICRGANIDCPAHLENSEILDITSNSKNVRQGSLFVGLVGTKENGHHYVDEAIINGAAAVVIEDQRYLCDKAILVDDTRLSLSHLMNSFCGNPTKKMKFIGVTGTNGKTSVCVMLKHILDEARIPCDYIGTLNGSMTTPDCEELYPRLAEMAGRGTKIVVMEASSHALALNKLAPIKFEIGIFTNFTQDHLDFHKTMEDYFKSKCKLFDLCERGIINVDDENLKKIKNLSECEIKTYSMKTNADYVATEIVDFGQNGTEFEIFAKNIKFFAKSKIPGQFSVMNTLAAISCACEIGVELNIVKRALESFCGVPGRLEKIKFSEGSGFAAFLDFAHTPDALKNLLLTAKTMKKDDGRIVLLFGCGGNRDSEKRAKMGRIATEYADLTIITSDNSRNENKMAIIKDILQGTDDEAELVVIPNRREAIEYAIQNARDGDIILLSGKGHENYEINANGKFAFDEKQIAIEAFNKYHRKL